MSHSPEASAALTVSPSALVLLAAFLLFSRSFTLPAAILTAALCHELSHVLALRLLGAPPRRLTLSATGAELYLTGMESLAPFAGAHLILGALNLLPVRPMDGGRLLWLLTALCTEPYTADRVAYIAGAAVSAALLALCLYLTASTGTGLFLLPGALWLAAKGVLPNGAKPDKINCYKK